MPVPRILWDIYSSIFTILGSHITWNPYNFSRIADFKQWSSCGFLEIRQVQAEMYTSTFQGVPSLNPKGWWSKTPFRNHEFTAPLGRSRYIFMIQFWDRYMTICSILYCTVSTVITALYLNYGFCTVQESNNLCKITIIYCKIIENSPGEGMAAKPPFHACRSTKTHPIWTPPSDLSKGTCSPCKCPPPWESRYLKKNNTT